MNTTTTALTKFPGSKRKVNGFFAREKITLKDIEDLDKLEREHLGQAATKILKQLKGEERDRFLDKIDQVIPADTKSDIWEYNHSAITSAISNYMHQHGVTPTKNAIAQVTGLSRQTVAKHFNTYKSSPEFTAHMEQFKFMAPKIMASVFRFAGNGDIRAARLYFEMVGAINKQNTNTVVNEQNNYIQINNTILSQENLKQLTPEQLTQIENIVTNKEYKIVS
jgi:activator of 2-hydroxyglutaryl-CoA dehydratase